MTGIDRQHNGRLYLLRIQTEPTGLSITLTEGHESVRRGFATLDDAVAYITACELQVSATQRDRHTDQSPNL